MRKTFTPVAAFGLLFSLLCYTSVVAKSKTDDPEAAKKIKASITRVGIGFESRVQVTLRDKTKLKGYLSEVGSDYFIVDDDETHAPTQISYSQVQKVNGKRHHGGMDFGEILGHVVCIVIMVGFVASMISSGGDF